MNALKKFLAAMQKKFAVLKFGGKSPFGGSATDPPKLVDRPIGAVAKALTNHWSKAPQVACPGTLTGIVKTVVIPAAHSPIDKGPAAYFVLHAAGAMVTTAQQRAAIRAVEVAAIAAAGKANTSTDSCDWRLVTMDFTEYFGPPPDTSPTVSDAGRRTAGPDKDKPPHDGTYFGVGATVGLARCCRPGLPASDHDMKAG